MSLDVENEIRSWSFLEFYVVSHLSRSDNPFDPEYFATIFHFISCVLSRKKHVSVENIIWWQIFLGLYGNDDLHNGLLEVLTAGRKVDNLVSSVRNQTNALEHTLTQKIRPQLTELADIFDEPVSNQTALSMLISSLDMVQKNITIATNAAGDIRRPLMGISMNHILNVRFSFFPSTFDMNHKWIFL